MNIRVPVSWLRDYLKTDVAAKTVANYLTACGPSIERIEKHDNEQVFDIEVTTNRPDAFSVYGIAREANAILINSGQESQLIAPVGLDQNLQPDTNYQLPLDVIIRDKSLCPRFAATIVDNIKIGPSPAIIKNRLEKSGIRSINNIVDISNYIMLELGQPMHTFDYDKIKGAKMILRKSTKGEKIKTIDGQLRKLPKGTIVIEDSQKLIDLCGIMGGENSAISSRTKRVVLFVQAYNPIRIRKTTQALAFRTDAAARFEKGIDLEGILPALKRAVYLTKKTAGAKIASELIDIYQKGASSKPITLTLEKIASYLGVEITSEKAAKILNSLGFKTASTSQTITATPPPWRVVDVKAEEDLIEEIARIYGYHNLPSKLPQGEIPKEEESILSKVIELKRALKYLGLTEIISYSIISKNLLNLTGVYQSEAVELINPLTEEWQFMRPTLLISLASVISQNQNIYKKIKIFEIAKTYEKQVDDVPKQDLKLAIVLSSSDFYEIKGIVENLFEILGRTPSYSSSKPFTSVILSEAKNLNKVQGKLRKSRSKKEVLDYARTINSALFEKSQSAQIKVGDTVVGTLGILNQSVTDYFGIEGDTFVAEVNLTTCYQLPATHYSYHPIPKLPPVIEDISAIFDEKTPVSDIITQVKRAGEPLVKKIEIMDIFTSEKIGKGKKSVTLRLTYHESTKTPDKEEVTKFRRIISDHLESYLKAKVRK